jgi:hypothetical protein
MSQKKTTQSKSNVNKSTAAKAQALATAATKLLKPGPALTPKRRKEVRGSLLNVTPTFIAAAVSAYQENAALLGNDLDPQAALDAQSFVTEMTPVATSYRNVATALEDSLLGNNATSAQFALAVYDRLQGAARLPQNTALASRVEQMEKLKKRRRKKATAVEASSAAVEPAVTKPA